MVDFCEHGNEHSRILTFQVLTRCLVSQGLNSMEFSKLVRWCLCGLSSNTCGHEGAY
jgi:hypothetical protein